MNKALLLLLPMIIILFSCGDQELEKKYVVEEVKQRYAEDEELLNREELLSRLESHGLAVEYRQAKRTPKSLEKTFPSKPREHFILSIDNEVFWVSRFQTIGQAKEVDLAFDDGFRFSNWHFAGQMTVETANRIVKALDSGIEE
ncbi:MAG: hypothetical protein GXP09_11720 [Gammaproteobacteria bacterium]|nr:hypothetical protein [Gammaproteobacteria bacterium]